MNLKELFKHWTYQVFSPGTLVRSKYEAFKTLLRFDNQSLEIIADLEEIYYGRKLVDYSRVVWLSKKLGLTVGQLTEQLMIMSPTRYLGLTDYFQKIEFYVSMGLDLPEPPHGPPYILPLDYAHENIGLTGGKAAGLSRLGHETGIPVPDGFVITTNGFNYFLEVNQLRKELDRRLRRINLSDAKGVSELCAEMKELVRQAQVPENVAFQISSATSVLARNGGLFSVRSSAAAEDSEEFSFAGQYESCLDVPAANVVESYKEVLASKYDVRAVSYRIRYGLADSETPMAVLVMPMVQADVSGVLYTNDQTHCKSEEGVQGIFAVRGRGDKLVSGRVTPQLFCVSRTSREILGSSLEDEGSIVTEDEVESLARYGMAAEEIFGCPQDVEWVMDGDRKIILVQSRPMAGKPSDEGRVAKTFKDHSPESILARGLKTASTGGGSGPVFVLKQMADVNSIPEDSVAVVPWLDPSLSQIVDRVAAVISQEGSRACHFASVAREFNLPVVYGIKNLEVLKEDQVVTVDADGGLVLSGRIEALLEEKKNRQQSRLAERLRHVMPQMITLNLTDHTAPSFSPEGCKSLHDIVRFVHEKSVQEMFTMVGKGSRAMNRAKRLKTELPLVMYVLDIEEGLFASARESDAITADDIKSSPMTALWWGLSSQDVVWDDSQLYMDWEEFDRISAGVFKKDSPLLASYAILAEDYAHVMVRFGYHFSIVDTLCGKDQKNNYINFRFKGGGGTPHQRNFRLQFIRGVLEPFDFQLTTRGDLLDASIRSLEEPSIHRRLAVLGYLLAKTRLMDFTLENETQVQDEIRDFLLKIRKRAL